MGARIPCSALLTLLCSLWNVVETIVTFVHYIWEQCRENRATFAQFMREDFQLTLSENRDFCAIFEQFLNYFVVHFRMVMSCTWSPLQTATGCTLHNMKLPTMFYDLFLASAVLFSCPVAVELREGAPSPISSLENTRHADSCCEKTSSRELGARYTVHHLPRTVGSVQYNICGMDSW